MDKGIRYHIEKKKRREKLYTAVKWTSIAVLVFLIIILGMAIDRILLCKAGVML